MNLLTSLSALHTWVGLWVSSLVTSKRRIITICYLTVLLPDKRGEDLPYLLQMGITMCTTLQSGIQ